MNRYRVMTIILGISLIAYWVSITLVGMDNIPIVVYKVVCNIIPVVVMFVAIFVLSRAHQRDTVKHSGYLMQSARICVFGDSDTRLVNDSVNITHVSRINVHRAGYIDEKVFPETAPFRPALRDYAAIVFLSVSNKPLQVWYFPTVEEAQSTHLRIVEKHMDIY